MNRDLSFLPKKHYDLLIVGGGINGAAMANLAAAAGARTVLIEKNDWASGTSSKSTKLLHGGIRYLENMEFDLVAESLKERFIQWKAVPHLARPLRFILPVYKGRGRPLWMIKIGVRLYDLLSGKYSLGHHAFLRPEEVCELVPALDKEGLCGAASYFDAQMDDARLCLENVLMARKRGADTYNHLEAVDFFKENGRAVGAVLRDRLSGQMSEVRADTIIVAAGPWSDDLREKDNPQAPRHLRPTKGVHLVCRGSIGRDAFLLQNPKDNRIFFMIPFKNNVLIGTTDTDYKGSPDDIRVEEADVEYLLSQSKTYFPGLPLGRQDIIATFAGLRPLVEEPGAPSKISRKHVIERTYSGIHYVMGGKYTTYRAIALECLGRALPQLRRRLPYEENYELFGSNLGQVDVKAAALRFGVAAQLVDSLTAVYGSRYADVLALIEKDASLKNPICSCSDVIRAQVLYAMRTEQACTVEDIFERRLDLQYNFCPTRQCRATIEEMLHSS